MILLGLAAALARPVPRAPQPILWLTPEGKVLVRGKAMAPRITEGAEPTPTPLGFGYEFYGNHGALLFPDLPAFALSGSLTVSTWIYLHAHVVSGPGAQILFRGDDRPGLDPYYLTLRPEGTVLFAINDPGNTVDQVSAPIPLSRWVHVAASLDAAAGRMTLWLDGRLVATALTRHRPLVKLSKSDFPGLSIGNVQNGSGPHNQPLYGMIADLRLYDVAVKPAAAGYRPFAG